MRIEAASTVEGRRPRLAGDILWLGITASVSVVIVGIMCWSLVAGLSPSAASGRPTAAVVTPETMAGSAVIAASPTLAINSIPTPGSPATIAETSTGSEPTTSIAARPKPADVKSPLQDTVADQLPDQHPAEHTGPTPSPSGAQPTRSATASLAAHAIGPRRPLQHHRHPGAAAR